MKYIENYLEFTQLPISIIKHEISNLKLPNFCIYDKSFINKLVSINDVNEYRELMLNLEINNYLFSQIVGEYRKKKYMEDIFYLNEKDMFEVTIDLFFEDFPYNVFWNIREMLSFLNSVNKQVLPEDRVQLYLKILNYKNLKKEERLNLFYKLATENNIKEDFYNDLRTCKNLSYSMIKNKLIVPAQKNFSTNLSKKFNHDIYELTGEKFYILITATHRSRESKQYSLLTTNALTSSFSLISHENITTFLDPDNNIIIGFDDFNIDNVMHVYEADAYTNHEFGSKLMPKIYTPQELMEKTQLYNEILYKNEIYEIEKGYVKKPLFPSYFVCYDEIKIGDLSAAKMHNVPIILIHSKYYKQKEGLLRLITDDDKAFLDRHLKPQNDYYIVDKEKVLTIN